MLPQRHFIKISYRDIFAHCDCSYCCSILVNFRSYFHGRTNFLLKNSFFFFSIVKWKSTTKKRKVSKCCTLNASSRSRMVRSEFQIEIENYHSASLSEMFEIYFQFRVCCHFQTIQFFVQNVVLRIFFRGENGNLSERGCV